MSFSRRRRAEAYADPLFHALVSAAVVRPLGGRAMVTSVAAGLLIDFDHPIAARSLEVDRVQGQFDRDVDRLQRRIQRELDQRLPASPTP